MEMMDQTIVTSDGISYNSKFSFGWGDGKVGDKKWWGDGKDLVFFFSCVFGWEDGKVEGWKTLLFWLRKKMRG